MLRWIKQKTNEPSRSHKIVMDAIQKEREITERAMKKMDLIRIDQRVKDYPIPFGTDRRNLRSV